MEKNIHLFTKDTFSKDSAVLDRIGIRGRQAMEFAAMQLPILPGFIIDMDIASDLQDADLVPVLKEKMEVLASFTGKTYGDPETPMLTKLVASSSLEISNYPNLHNFGLTEGTIAGFNQHVGDDFGYSEILYLAKGNLEVEKRIAELEADKTRLTQIEKLRSKMINWEKNRPASLTCGKLMAEIGKVLPEGFFGEPFEQLSIAIKRLSRLLLLDEMADNDVAIIVQPMVHGNFGKNSASGLFYTRNIISGDAVITGQFYRNKFNEVAATGNDINKIEAEFLKELIKIGNSVEEHYREIRAIRFTIEDGKLWLIDQRPTMMKSSQAHLRTLLDLNSKKIMSDEEIINAFKTNQLSEILHPIIDTPSTRGLKKLEGGIAGAPGAAIGRVYYSTDALLEAYKNAQHMDQDNRCILVMPATFAEDVKAIEVATGVLSHEGGYSAHASVVARQYGKVSLVNKDIKFQGKKAVIGGVTVKEGDFVSLSVPNYGDPVIYFGEAQLIQPDLEKSGLLEFLEIVKKKVSGFHVRANADNARDAELALKLGAEGIGLCRTEHMFFDEKRINVFRSMIISDTREKRIASLNKLKTMQKNDFIKLFRVMNGKPVTIRLMDAPLHEFMPHDDSEMKKFVAYMKTQKGYSNITPKQVAELCDTHKEFNPMLGHRGCRIAISYPEIYEMQVQAIFEAVYALKKDKVAVHPEIMVPIIMNENELKIIVYGKNIEGDSIKGLVEVEKEVRKRLKARPVDFKIGTMIELPVAALGAGEIARYAEFFSFGTNDLTQTTLGLSRDDFNSFMPDYTTFDVIDGNPFQILNRAVKELVATAVRRGKMARPDLKKGLCGEHGAVPENIRFCMETGLDYVSCSSYSIPAATLAIAQQNIAAEKMD